MDLQQTAAASADHNGAVANSDLGQIIINYCGWPLISAFISQAHHLAGEGEGVH